MKIRKSALKYLILLMVLMVTCIVYAQNMKELESRSLPSIGFHIEVTENQIFFEDQKISLGQLNDKLNRSIETTVKELGLKERPKILISIFIDKDTDQKIVEDVFNICKTTEKATFNVNGVYMEAPHLPTQAEIKEALSYGFSKSGNAIRVPVGKILLVRQGNIYGAIKIVKSEENSAEYEWYYQTDGSGDFTSKTATKGFGKVFEKHKNVAITPKSYSVIDKGSQLFIEFGNFKFEWSRSNWIYFPEKEDPQRPTGMVLTEESDIQKVNVKSPELNFFKRR